MNNPNRFHDNSAQHGRHLWDVMLAPLFMLVVALGALAFIAK